MKSFLTLIAINFLLTNYTLSQWFWQNPLPTGNTLYSVDFVDSNNGWAVGAAGTIVKSTDGGINWIAQSSGTLMNLKGISFTDRDNGTVVLGEFPLPMKITELLLVGKEQF